MPNLYLPNITVCAGDSTANVDILAAIHIVDVPWSEAVVEVCREHASIGDSNTRPLDAEGSDRPILRKLARREYDLSRDLRRSRIPRPDRSVVSRLSGDDRATDKSL